MKLIVQRVFRASVAVEGREISEIGKGFFVLLGVKDGDMEKEAEILAEKLSKLRVMSFDFAQDKSDPPSPKASEGHSKMNLTVGDVGGEMLVVSQFTLYGDTKGGNRPSFIQAARPEIAKPLYEYFVAQLKSRGVRVQTGKFGAMMKISAVLDGPVTILIES